MPELHCPICGRTDKHDCKGIPSIQRQHSMMAMAPGHLTIGLGPEWEIKVKGELKPMSDDYFSPKDLRKEFENANAWESECLRQLVHELANALEYAWSNPTDEQINKSMYTPAFANELIKLARDVLKGEV